LPSGEEAVTFALEHKPDLILMDIRLDGLISGIDAVKQIHEHMSVPVIYISGSTDALNNGALKGSDYVTFLPKPITFSELSNSLRIDYHNGLEIRLSAASYRYRICLYCRRSAIETAAFRYSLISKIRALLL